MNMGNERFSVPELLFNPSDVGQYTRSVYAWPSCFVS